MEAKSNLPLEVTGCILTMSGAKEISCPIYVLYAKIVTEKAIPTLRKLTVNSNQ